MEFTQCNPLLMAQPHCEQSVSRRKHKVPRSFSNQPNSWQAFSRTGNRPDYSGARDRARETLVDQQLRIFLGERRQLVRNRFPILWAKLRRVQARPDAITSGRPLQNAIYPACDSIGRVIVQ